MNLYFKYIDAGVGFEDTCSNCGGEFGIHNCHTMQCQKDGIDLPGELPEWDGTTFKPFVMHATSKLLDKNFDIGKYADQLMEKIFGTVQTEVI